MVYHVTTGVTSGDGHAGPSGGRPLIRAFWVQVSQKSLRSRSTSCRESFLGALPGITIRDWSLITGRGGLQNGKGGGT